MTIDDNKHRVVQSDLTLDWGGHWWTLHPSHHPHDGESLWCVKMGSGVWLNAIRVEGTGDTPTPSWKVFVGILGTGCGDGWTLADAATECRANLDSRRADLRNHVATLTKALTGDEPILVMGTGPAQPVIAIRDSEHVAELFGAGSPIHLATMPPRLTLREHLEEYFGESHARATNPRVVLSNRAGWRRTVIRFALWVAGKAGAQVVEP